MPIYEYACSACGHRSEILHGINDSGPNFCPECGAEGTMRKGFAPPAVVFKGSGWAKKDRRSAASSPGRDGKEKGDSTAPEKPEAEKAATGKSESGKSESGKSESATSGSGSSDAKATPKASEGG